MWIGMAFVAVLAALLVGWTFLAIVDPDALYREGKR